MAVHVIQNLPSALPPAPGSPEAAAAIERVKKQLAANKHLYRKGLAALDNYTNPLSKAIYSKEVM